MIESGAGQRQGAVRRRAVAGVCLATGWACFALLLGPALIRLAYSGTDLPLLSSILSGRGLHPVDRYLAAWWSLVGKLTLLLVAGVAGVALLLWDRPGLGRRLSAIVFGGRVVPASRALAIAGFVGMLSGLAEFAVWKVRFLADGHFARWSNGDTIWTAPLVATAIAAFAVLPLALMARLGRRQVNAALVAAISGFVGIYGLLRSAEIGIHPAAAILLAVGLAVTVARFAAGRGVLFRPGLVRACGLAVLAMVGLGLAMSVGRAVRDRLAVAGLGPAPVGAQNVVFIILDTVRAESLSLYGYARETSPELDRLASRGLVFDRAIAPAPWTLPSHASMFTGLNPSQHMADWTEPLDARSPTLATFLSSQGFATAGFVANLSFTTRASGLSRGFSHYEDYGLDARSLLGSVWYGREVRDELADASGYVELARKDASEINADALDWIDSVDRPFFVFLNYFDAHGPYLMRADHASRVLRTPVSDNVPDETGELVERPDHLSEWMDRYDTSLAYLDEQIGRFVDALGERGLLDRTLIVITSDHGEQFGEHDLTDHGNSLFDPLLHVPLIMLAPGTGVAAGRVSGSVSLTDIPATIVDYLGLKAGSPFPGRSLLEAAKDPTVAQRTRFALSEVTPNPMTDLVLLPGDGPAIAISQDLHRLVRYADGTEDLFDLRTDGDETTDLSGRADMAAVRRVLAARIDSVVRIARNRSRHGVQGAIAESGN